MEKKYINEARYKKGTIRKRRSLNTVKSNLEPKKEVKIAEKKKPKKKIKKTYKENKTANIVVCIILLVIIAVISRAILKDEDEPFIPLPFITNSNDEIIKIGVITTDNLLEANPSNVILSELNKYSKDMLLEINEDYTITYRVVSKVEKVSNSEYILTRNEESKVSIEEIKNAIDNHKSNKNSIYYNKLMSVNSTEVVNANTLNIKLKEDNPYFIYNLDIVLDTAKDRVKYTQDKSSTESMLVLNRHKSADKQNPLKIIVTSYKDVYAAAQAYKEKQINVFVTNAENVQNVLGKYEYNITAYRNGQSVFLLGNSKSNVYSKQEVRKAIAYSIDRDGIIKDILKSKGVKIDLPYIYDDVKYKYDIYAAENLLLTNGYTKSNKVYSKTEKGVKTTLELDLILNKQDEVKVGMAEKIKNNLGSIGIKINVEKLTEEKLQTRIKKGDYDLLLASVNLNNSPDISFVQDKLFTTEVIKEVKENIDKTNIQELNKNINSLQTTLSEQISAIGIYSDVSYLVYSKDIIGIENVSYMNLLKSLFK